MSKSRINKFIFREGKVFLRLKTTAKNLKVVKSETDYTMDFAVHGLKGNMASIPVVWVDTKVNDEYLKAEALSFGCKEDKLENAVSKKEQAWGEQTLIKTPSNREVYYYLCPHDQDYGVKLGPIPKNIEGARFEMDLENLQWGHEG